MCVRFLPPLTDSDDLLNRGARCVGRRLLLFVIPESPHRNQRTSHVRSMDAQFPLVSRYVDILRSTGIDWGLLGPREADRLWDRHILNSAALSGLISPGSAIADVGSGAGLPGIPLSLLRPDLRVT